MFPRTLGTANCKPNSNWVIGNVAEMMYYRVNYNEGNWNNIISALKTDPEVTSIIISILSLTEHISNHKPNHVPIFFHAENRKCGEQGTDYWWCIQFGKVRIKL